MRRIRLARLLAITLLLAVVLAMLCVQVVAAQDYERIIYDGVPIMVPTEPVARAAAMAALDAYGPPPPPPGWTEPIETATTSFAQKNVDSGPSVNEVQAQQATADYLERYPQVLTVTNPLW